IIAIFNEINYPELIDKIRLLGHDLAITSYVVESELLDKNSSKITEMYVQSGKIQILKNNPIKEILKFQKKFPKLGLGECYSMLAYQKLRDAGERVYCILDDYDARKKATKLGIKFTGLIGLLLMMKQKDMMSSYEFDKVVRLLKDSNFRFPAGVII
ncbi:MAG: hypothetical protein OXC46_03755, partial [Thaumarchaeota archaeon]|nr:hypothetical protein [Nitrososphaerota archaeon]